MRWRISAAALRVKVMARISSGRSETASKRNTRCTSSEVLPEPAGALTAKEALISSAFWRTEASASLWLVFGMPVHKILIFRHTVQTGELVCSAKNRRCFKNAAISVRITLG